MINVEQVEKDLRRFKNDYLDLLNQVMTAAERVEQHFGSSIISGIYSRPNTGEGPFKDPLKIAMKIRDQEIKEGPGALLDLNDVIGVTIVVQYPDGREPVIERLRDELVDVADVGDAEVHENKRGYYAHHVIVEREYGVTLRCEVQVKTMLHDAWAKKMHNLTYKPGGTLDERLAELMISGANMIESAERQSQTIRDMIVAGWDVEREARQQARDSVFDEMLFYNSELLGGSGQADIEQLYKDIEAAAAWIADEPPNSARLKDLLRRINGCRTKHVRFGWMLAGRLATIWSNKRLQSSCIVLTDLWLEELPKWLKEGKVQSREVSAIPLLFYVMNELDYSIHYADRVLAATQGCGLEPRNVATIRFNQAQALVEREYHQPLRDDEEREALHMRVRAALADPTLRLNDDIESSIVDLEGMIRFTFATTKEEVREGIRLCEQAVALAVPREKVVTDAYAELNIRLGWRRYFELEAKELVRRKIIR